MELAMLSQSVPHLVPLMAGNLDIFPCSHGLLHHTACIGCCSSSDFVEFVLSGSGDSLDMASHDGK